MAEERREVRPIPSISREIQYPIFSLSTFQAIKAFVLVKQPDASTHRRGVEETIQLCRRTPAITDLDALHQIQDTLKDLSLEGDETTTLWDRAVATKPEDKELATTWLHRSVADNNWLGAQKVC